MAKNKISYNHWIIQSLEEHNRRRKQLKIYFDNQEKRRLGYEAELKSRGAYVRNQ